MLIDCDSCAIRGLGCGDCVVSMFLLTTRQRGSSVELDEDEFNAVAMLAAGGLVSPLRLVPMQPTVPMQLRNHHVAS